MGSESFKGKQENTIRVLKESDRELLLRYLDKQPSLNIFIIGDVEAFGFENDFQTLYAEFDKKGKYLSVLLFYRDNCVYYSHIDYFNKDWLKIMNNHNFNFFSGKESLMNLLYKYLPNFTKSDMYFAEATNSVNINEYDFSNILEFKNENDAGKLYDCLLTINEFSVDRENRDSYIKSRMASMSMGVSYFIKEDGVIVSTVATTAETTKAAMVVAVATLKVGRQKGYASKLMVYLMNEYIVNRKKYLCLFYDNPEAGKIYKRLGFKDIDKWSLLKKNKSMEE
ncbi:MAG: GNAT family N-acetyltransferase [Candidatus Izemoplasma sp.]